MWIQKNRHGPRIDPIALEFDGEKYTFLDHGPTARNAWDWKRYPAELFLHANDSTDS